jgi:hypothetical protein
MGDGLPILEAEADDARQEALVLGLGPGASPLADQVEAIGGVVAREWQGIIAELQDCLEFGHRKWALGDS